MKKGLLNLCDLYDFTNVLISKQFKGFGDGAVAFSYHLYTAFPQDIEVMHPYAGLGTVYGYSS